MALVAALGCLPFPMYIPAHHYQNGTDVLAMSLAMMCWFQEGAVIVRRHYHTLFSTYRTGRRTHDWAAAYRSGVSFWAKTDEWNEHGADRRKRVKRAAEPLV